LCSSVGVADHPAHLVLDVHHARGAVGAGLGAHPVVGGLYDDRAQLVQPGGVTSIIW
jgi:hypothetical protein